jgi:hypothetical protein
MNFLFENVYSNCLTFSRNCVKKMIKEFSALQKFLLLEYSLRLFFVLSSHEDLNIIKLS